jgi:hypothetical protein
MRGAGDRRQSLQLRNFNGAGNPIIGAVSWTGPAYPSHLRVSCNLRIKEADKTCQVDESVS